MGLGSPSQLITTSIKKLAIYNSPTGAGKRVSFRREETSLRIRYPEWDFIYDGQCPSAPGMYVSSCLNRNRARPKDSATREERVNHWDARNEAMGGDSLAHPRPPCERIVCQRS